MDEHQQYVGQTAIAVYSDYTRLPSENKGRRAVRDLEKEREGGTSLQMMLIYIFTVFTTKSKQYIKNPRALSEER